MGPDFRDNKKFDYPINREAKRRGLLGTKAKELQEKKAIENSDNRGVEINYNDIPPYYKSDKIEDIKEFFNKLDGYINMGISINPMDTELKKRMSEFFKNNDIKGYAFVGQVTLFGERVYYLHKHKMEE